MSDAKSDYIQFEKALRNMERYHKASMERQASGNVDLEELYKMGLIQSFEACYAALLKALRRHLTEEIGVLDLSDGAKAIFRAADRNALLGDGAEHWFEYAKARNTSSHEYGIEKLGHVLELIPAFLTDTIKLYETMTGVSWKKK